MWSPRKWCDVTAFCCLRRGRLQGIACRTARLVRSYSGAAGKAGHRAILPPWLWLGTGVMGRALEKECVTLAVAAEGLAILKSVRAWVLSAATDALCSPDGVRGWAQPLPRAVRRTAMTVLAQQQQLNQCDAPSLRSSHAWR